MSLSAESLAQVRFAGRQKIRIRQDFGAVRPSARTRPRECDALPEDEHHFVSAVFQRSGLAVDHYRVRPLRRRIAAALRSARASELLECQHAIQADKCLSDKVLNSLLIGYTTPFRDEPIFRRLRHDVLPALVATRPELRVWSAGCSNGAELYSVSLLLAELRCLEKCTLRGTDSRPMAITDARKYARSFLATVPPGFADLKEAVAELPFVNQLGRIEWKLENVLSVTKEASFDLICCRNLAIYLQPSAAAELWAIMARALVPQGILVTGKAEKPSPARQWHRVDNCIYQSVKP